MNKLFDIKTPLPPLPAGYPISAKIVRDSISLDRVRLTTFELEFPRFILAELNTHRVFSRNTSSSRAIPISKTLNKISVSEIVEPVRYGKNKAGMQAAPENLVGDNLEEARNIWRGMAEHVMRGCKKLSELGLHKQWAGRPLEWFSTSRVVLSTTDLENFFILRDHVDAQEEICYLAQAMKVAISASTPVPILYGDWHIPYVAPEEIEQLGLEDALKVSASRCARTSMKTHLGVTSTLKEDLELFRKLKKTDDSPFHASPTEHQATPTTDSKFTANFRGWVQFRHFVEQNLSIKK